MKNAFRLLILLMVAGCVFLIHYPAQALDISGTCPEVDRTCYLPYINSLNNNIVTNKYWIPLQLSIPFPNCNSIDDFACIDNQVVAVKSLAELTLALFQFATIMIAIFLSALLVIGGLMYLVSGGASDYVSKSKDLMKNAFLSLLVVLFAYVILYQINPVLVNPQLSQIETVQNIPCCKVKDFPEFYFADFNNDTKLYECVPGDEEASDLQCLTTQKVDLGGEQASGSIPPSAGELIEMKSGNGIFVRTENKLISEDIWNDLNEVATQMQSLGYGGIVVTSGARTVEVQEKEAAKNPAACKIKDGKKESCPHTSGVAVDVWGAKTDGTQCVYKEGTNAPPDALRCWGKTEEEATNKIRACLTDPCHKALVDAMMSRGYCILLGSNTPRYREVWHFEKSNPPVSAGCTNNIPSKYLSNPNPTQPSRDFDFN